MGRLLLFLLTKVKFNGRKNFPKTGPLILAGNHVGVMEVMMMAVYPPYNLEFMGSGDIPLDPNFAWLAKLWGFIPIDRGNLDREAIKKSVDVLRGKGVVVVFPEGGIWSPGEMQVRMGIALLSGLADAPVLPIGFCGMQGALSQALRFKRPLLVMNVGEKIPSIQLIQPGKSRKQALEEGTQVIWSKIKELIPPAERIISPKFTNERFELEMKLFSSDMKEKQEKQTLEIDNPQSLSRFLLHPVILDIFYRNLKLPVASLMNISKVTHPEEIMRSCKTVLDYLAQNQGFLNYRFGMREGINMQHGLQQLFEIATYAYQNELKLSIRPFRKYIDSERGLEVVEGTLRPPNQY